MKKIDAHQHIWLDDSLENLARRTEENGVEKVCLFACGELYNEAENEDVRKAFERYPGLILPFGYVRLGRDNAELVDRLHDDGFVGLKMICPMRPYNHVEYFRVYEKAARHKMPIVFHTGIVAPYPRDGEFSVDSALMRPVFLDGIARAFPDLPIIGAHLGVPWIDEALMIATFNSNVYFDLSGVEHLADAPGAYFLSLLYWKGAFDKLMFGCDSPYDRYAESVANHTKIATNHHFSPEQTHNYFYGTIARLLGLGEK